MTEENLITQDTSSSTEAFTLIDLLQVIVDNLRLLVIGPIVAGLVAFTAASLSPKTYESTAILKAEQTTASLIHSADMLNPIAESLGYTNGMDADAARTKLKAQIQARFSTKDKLLTLTGKAASPQDAQALTLLVLQQVYAQSKPRGSQKTRLEKQLEQAKASEKEASQSAQFLGKKLKSTGTAGVSEAAQGYSQLIRIVQERQAAQSTIEQQLNGLDASVLVQEATLPTKHSEPKRGLSTVLAVQAAGFLLLIWVFIRNSIKNTKRDSNSAKKLEKLKSSWLQALGLSQRVR